MISSSPSPSPVLYSQRGSPRNNVWNRPTHPRSSSFSMVGGNGSTSRSRTSPKMSSSEMKRTFSRSPRPAPVYPAAPAREMRNASTQWSSPETPELEKSTVPGKRKARAQEETELPKEPDSPPRPRLTPQTHAATPAQQKAGGPSPKATVPQQTVASKPPETAATIPSASTTQPQNTATTNDTPSPKRPRPENPSIKTVPVNYEDCPTSDLVPIISSMIMELIRHNDTPVTNTGLTRFHSRAPPGISVQDYLQRLAHHATLSPPILLSMVYYIDRLCAIWPKFTINSLTVHRYLIASATVAAKGLSDSFWTNATYARVGGVSLKELALLELEFLWRIEWRIVPKPEVLVDYYRSLVQRCEGYEIAQQDVKGEEMNVDG